MTYHIFAKISNPFVETEVEANSQEDALAKYYSEHKEAPRTAVAYLKEF